MFFRRTLTINIRKHYYSNLAGMYPKQNVAVQFVRDIVNIKTLTFKCRLRIYFKDGTFLASTRHK